MEETVFCHQRQVKSITYGVAHLDVSITLSSCVVLKGNFIAIL